MLTVLSHVSHGYVGNRAIVFCLQHYGWDVDAINTTDYSNHPGYKKFRGKPSTPERICELFLGLKDIINFTSEYEIILTGYSPNEHISEVIYSQVTDIYKQNAKKAPIWVLDPVLGDNGKLYVPENVVPVVKKMLASRHVTLTTPNQFEFEVLSGVKIDSWSSVRTAFEAFYKAYTVPYVVLSSVTIDRQMYTIGYAYASQQQIFAIPVDEIDCHFSGCGDVFTALITHSFYDNNALTAKSLALVVLKLNKILLHSLQEEQQKTGAKVLVVNDIRSISLRHFLTEDNERELSLDKVRYL